MLETINNFILRIADPLFGWILFLPRDAALFAVAIMTSLILTYVRKFTTDQAWLKQADEDQKRLGELIREAKKAGLKDDAKRFKDTAVQIKMRSMKYEGMPLLAALLPILLLATWCFARLGFEPPRAGEIVQVKMYVPLSGIGKLAHITPRPGVEAPEGWIRKVVPDTLPEPGGWWGRINAAAMKKLGMLPPLEGVAVWNVRAVADPLPRALRFVCDGQAFDKDLLVGQRRYSDPVRMFGNEGPVQAIETVLKPVKLFGVVPGVDMLFLPPWLTAYLLIAIPFVTIIKRVLRIY
jgi:uncharacterized membrane protein (DUF106 family)